MNSIEEINKYKTKRLLDYTREVLEDQGITLIEDEDIYWIMERNPDDEIVKKGIRPQREICFEEDEALARLLVEEVIYLRSDKERKIFRFSVVCSDIFAWACSDSEPLEYHELQDLYDMWIKNKTWGPAKWCCIKRNQKPQDPVVDAMKKAGAWNDEMEALGENTMDKEVQAAFAWAAQQIKNK